MDLAFLAGEKLHKKSEPNVSTDFALKSKHSWNFR